MCVVLIKFIGATYNRKMRVSARYQLIYSRIYILIAGYAELLISYTVKWLQNSLSLIASLQKTHLFCYGIGVTIQRKSDYREASDDF